MCHHTWLNELFKKIFFVALEFELKSLALARQVLNHLKHAYSMEFVVYCWDWGLNKGFGTCKVDALLIALVILEMGVL
jgi:hypothetical protein